MVMRDAWNLDSRCTVLLPGVPGYEGFDPVYLMMLKNCGDVMKQIISTYSFDKTAKTVTFTDFSSISLSRVLLITNVTANIIMYQFNNPALGGTAAGNVLTLTFDTSAMDDADKLQIIYDCAIGDPLYEAASVVLRYNATPPIIPDGQRSEAQADVNGALLVNLAKQIAGEDLDKNVLGIMQKPVTGGTYAPLNYSNSGTSAAANIKPAAGNVFSVVVTSASTAVRYLQLHNKSSAPMAGDSAQLNIVIPAGSATVPWIEKRGTNDLITEYFSQGIGFAISSTYGTYATAGVTASEHTINIRCK